jgi:hypothetical protein
MNFLRAILAFCLLAATAGRAEERVTRPYPGVTHIHRTDGEQDYHLLILAPGAMEVVSTDQEEAW